MRHDLKNHLHCIASFIELGSIRMRFITSMRFTPIPGTCLPRSTLGTILISILLNDAKERASLNNIRMTVNVMVPPDLPD